LFINCFFFVSPYVVRNKLAVKKVYKKRHKSYMAVCFYLNLLLIRKTYFHYFCLKLYNFYSFPLIVDCYLPKIVFKNTGCNTVWVIFWNILHICSGNFFYTLYTVFVFLSPWTVILIMQRKANPEHQYVSPELLRLIFSL
jgi:hypothetical protein